MKRKIRSVKIIFILLLFLIIGVFTAGALQEDKIEGFDFLMSENISKLNNQGKAQLINKSFTFEDGKKATLRGIITDENKMMIFMEVEITEEEVDDVDFGLETIVFGEKYLEMTYGRFFYDNEKNILYGAQSYEGNVDYSIEGVLSFHRMKKEAYHTGEIRFKVDKDKIMKPIKLKNHKEKIKFEDGTLYITDVKATPMSTFVYGKRQTALEIIFHRLFHKDEKIKEIDLDLMADDTRLRWVAHDSSTDSGGKSEVWEFEGVPEGTEELKLTVCGYRVNDDIDEKIKISEEVLPLEVLFRENPIVFEKIDIKDGKTMLTFSSDEGVLLKDIWMIHDSGECIWDRTIDDENYEENGKRKHRRTLLFQEEAEGNVEIKVKGISYKKRVEKTVYLK